MTGVEFKSWRMAREWSQDMAAAALGVSRRTIVVLEANGEGDIPRLYALAVRGVNATGSDLPTRKRAAKRKTGSGAIEAAVQRAMGSVSPRDKS